MERFGVSAGGIAYVDEGRGPPVLLLHGFPTSSYLWRNLIPFLAQRMRVVAPDLLGYGASEKAEDSDLTVRAQAAYVRELLAHLGIEEFAVVGHDLGGAIAQLLALEGGVLAMVLVDSAAFDVWPIEGVRMLQDARPEQETPEFVQQVLRLTFELGLGHVDRLTDDVFAAYREPFAGEEGGRAFFRAARAIDGVGLADREEELASLEIPVMLLWGEDDPYLPVEVADRLNEAIPTSTLALLPGCSHFLPEDAPDTVGALVYEYLRARYLAEEHGHEQPVISLESLRRGHA
jgi:pimeloyl-ACP methyl ester carboxylesterase